MQDTRNENPACFDTPISGAYPHLKLEMKQQIVLERQHPLITDNQRILLCYVILLFCFKILIIGINIFSSNQINQKRSERSIYWYRHKEK